MKVYSQLGRLGALLVLALGAAEVIIMISPFAGFFYASLRFEPLLGFLSASPLTAWLDGFFLNHSVVTSSGLLEWQRTLGSYLFALGIWGFLISAVQVYSCKIAKRGVATGLLYRYWRHPQYLCLAIAGWGLLTIWPRFLLLGLWVTMLFLYIALARFEEQRMKERFGDAYRRYAEGKWLFLPGGLGKRMFEATFGRLRPRVVGLFAAYGVCLLAAFGAGFILRAYTRSNAAILFKSDQRAVVISAWPESEEWMASVFETAYEVPEVRKEIDARASEAVVATVLPPQYVMRSMYYVLPPDPGSRESVPTLGRIFRIAGLLMVPWMRPDDFMGVDPGESDSPVQVVFSRAEKPYKEGLRLEEALDASVRLTPLVVADVYPGGRVDRVQVPLPQNRWGPEVVMPLF